MSLTPLIECIPNFSEGRDMKVIKAIEHGIRETSGVSLLHVDIGYDANRTVMTFAGEPSAVCDAAFKACQKATELIDMTQQHGTHPRLGAMDVCPLVALKRITSQELLPYAERLGDRLGQELNIPVYLYEHSANQPTRKRLEQIRKGGYQNFQIKMKDPEWAPNFGPSEFNRSTGVTVLGVRDLLLAFNINLSTSDIKIAKQIARKVRSSGYKGQAGLFKNLKAIGWFVNQYGCAQVSTNITNFEQTPAHEVLEAIRNEAIKHDVKVTGSELIGLIPQAAIIAAGRYYNPDLIDTQALTRSAIVGLGLADKQKFVPTERILDLALKTHGLLA